MAPDGARGCRASLPFSSFSFFFFLKNSSFGLACTQTFSEAGRGPLPAAPPGSACPRACALSLERVHSFKPCACIAFVMKKQLVFPNEP